MKLSFGYMSRWWIMMVAVMAITHSAQALVIYGGAAGQTTDPGDGLPWDNVGNTGVYLGAYDTGYWVITANHVGSGGITLGGDFYASLGGSAQRIGTTDLLLYRINVSTHGAPELENLNISPSTPVAGQPVVMVADGGGTMTWGTNTVHQYANYSLSEGGPQTVGLITTYSPITGEAQGQSGDSGGALFYQQLDGSWLLSGILSGLLCRHRGDRGHRTGTDTRAGKRGGACGRGGFGCRRLCAPAPRINGGCYQCRYSPFSRSRANWTKSCTVRSTSSRSTISLGVCM